MLHQEVLLRVYPFVILEGHLSLEKDLLLIDILAGLRRDESLKSSCISPGYPEKFGLHRA
jgi:hypothetical protein